MCDFDIGVHTLMQIQNVNFLVAHLAVSVPGSLHLAEPGCLCTKQALVSPGEQAFPHSKWCGHLKSHLDYYCFMRKGLEFAPQQMPGTS